MSNPNQVSMTFPTAVQFKGAFEYSSNKEYNQMTTADIKVYQPTLTVYLLKKAGVLEESNVIADININVNESVTLNVDGTIKRTHSFNLWYWLRILSRLKNILRKSW